MVKWFGKPWPADWEEHGRAPVCSDEADRVGVPVGLRCFQCQIPIRTGDSGVVIPHMGRPGTQPTTNPFHIECFLRMVLGPSWNTFVQL